MKKFYYLRIGDDTLEEARCYRTLADAVQVFRAEAGDLARFGQGLAATIHIAGCRAEIVEYPDYFLELGDRGGLRCVRC